MSPRILSVVLPLVSLSFFSTFVVCAGINVTAICISSTWTYNSIGQSPCIVAANMLATCYAGSYTIAPLSPGYSYDGPSGPESSTKCECSTIGYSLLSACATCQNEIPFNWTQYTINCPASVTEPPAQFPNAVPAGIYVPHWAILDVTNENFWNPNESYAAGDTPEYGPGALFGASGVSTATTSARTSSASASTSSAGTPPAPTVTPSHSKSHAGVIAGVVGGIALVAIIAALIYLLRRRARRLQAAAKDTSSGASQPMLSDTLTVSQSSSVPPIIPQAPQTLMRLYNPNDPTTYPGYQGSSQTVNISRGPGSQLTLPSHVGSGPSSGSRTLAEMPITLPNTTYPGYPMPH